MPVLYKTLFIIVLAATGVASVYALGTTGAPRPSAKEVAWPLMEDFLNRNWITIDMIKEDKYNQIKEKYPNIKDYIKL